MYKFKGMFSTNLLNIFLAQKIMNIDWHSKLNKAAHHTSDYNSTQMILRRGQAFTITLNFQRTVQPEDNFTFIASTGNFIMAITSHPGQDLNHCCLVAFCVIINLCSTSFN